MLVAARQMTTIPGQFEQTLSAVPDKAAVFSGGESLTFRRLHAEAAATAQALASLGVLAGDRVGICMQKNLDQVIAILGVLWANAIFVPIHPVLHAEQIGHMVDDCDMKLLITDSTRITELRDAAHGRIVVGHGPAEEEMPSLKELRKKYQNAPVFFRAKPEDTAGIIYSSGSTGRPKGIMISHRNLADGSRIVVTAPSSVGPADFDRQSDPRSRALRLGRPRTRLPAGCSRPACPPRWLRGQGILECASSDSRTIPADRSFSWRNSRFFRRSRAPRRGRILVFPCAYGLNDKDARLPRQSDGN